MEAPVISFEQMNRRSFITITSGGLSSSWLTAGAQTGGIKPPNGFVPHEEAASAIARVVASAWYGKETIDAELPLVTKRLGDAVWKVVGSLPKAPDIMGGVVEVHISQKDGCILYMTHGR